MHVCCFYLFIYVFLVSSFVLLVFFPLILSVLSFFFSFFLVCLLAFFLCCLFKFIVHIIVVAVYSETLTALKLIYPLSHHDCPLGHCVLSRLFQSSDVTDPFLTVTGKFSKGTLPYVFRSCQRHSELTDEKHIPLRPTPKRDTLRHWRYNRLGLVGWLLIVPATGECISGTDLHRQFYVLPH